MISVGPRQLRIEEIVEIFVETAARGWIDLISSLEFL
jgi:hypothetical protein